MADVRETLQSSLGSAYTIGRELGGGGMSRVFVADDTALGRAVVVKVLPPDMAASVSIGRFRREIMLAARLQHPHIVPLLSAGDTDGLPFFTMPYVEGESLRLRLSRGGEFPVPDGVRLLREIATALDYAHEKGVVHRDIKPDNVLLSRGSAMVTDFGVAKALSASSNSEIGSVTSVGVALGTPAYMSPEQAAASPAIDARADLYAFGVLAYELFAGRPPFSGRSPQATLAAQITELPEPVQKVRASLPPALSALIMRCLEKHPADRPQSAAEIVRALDAITTPSGGTQPAIALTAGTSGAVGRGGRRMFAAIAVAVVIVAGVSWFATRGHSSSRPGSGFRSIAVLPFENKSGDSAYDYVVEGVSDEVRSSLTNVSGLSVKARGSSNHFKGGSDARDAGKRLDVETVLVGSLSGSSTRLHLVAELVKVADGDALWSRTFDRAATEMAVVQDSIIHEVISAMHGRAAQAETDSSTGRGARGTTDAEAYDLFLRGVHALTVNAPPRAIASFKQAIAKDPKFARAYAGLAAAYTMTPIEGFASRDSAMGLARRAVEQSVAIDSTLPEVAMAQGGLFEMDFKFADAERVTGVAAAAYPQRPELRYRHAAALYQLGRLPESLAELREAQRLNPLDVGLLTAFQYTLYVARDYRAAITVTGRLLDLEPQNISAYQNLGLAYVFANQPDSAVAAFEKAVTLGPTFGGRIYLIFGLSAAGRWKDADAQRALFEQEPPGNSPNFRRGYVDIAFGRFDAAVSDLERSLANLEPLVITNGIPCDPVFDPLKSNPRFVKAVQRLWPRICPASATWPIKPRR